MPGRLNFEMHSEFGETVHDKNHKNDLKIKRPNNLHSKKKKKKINH